MVHLHQSWDEDYRRNCAWFDEKDLLHHTRPLAVCPPPGKMQNYELVHSSRVRFIYPSEDEMADLTFIVADRKSPASSSSSSSFNILLYLLVFQVLLPVS